MDFCLSVGWQAKPFDPSTKLIRAINKTLSHMTYSRDRAAVGHVHFEGHEHVHGTVTLMRKTWADFMKSVKPEFLQPLCPKDIQYYLVDHTKEWRVNFSKLEIEFERRVNELVRLAEEQERRGIPVAYKWTLNRTPDS